MADQDDDYRSSDDEDYIPDAAIEDLEDESSGDEGKKKPAEPSVDVDAIFASMLEDDEKLIPINSLSYEKSMANQPSTSSLSTASSSSKNTPVESKITENKTFTEVYDFAGEEVRIEKTVSMEEFEKIEDQKKKASEKADKKPTQKRIGLGDALTLLKKKPKMSILDKSNHDWTNFKKENDLQEELQTFNRGKQGYLNKVEFLTRTDYREFENERNLRNSTRRH